MIEELLEHIKEDKHENLSTTSKKFKEDMWNFFMKEEIFRGMNCCEFGTHKGQTTYILSHLFNHVYTINLSNKHFKEARILNSTRSNISYIPFNLYEEKLTYNPIYDELDVFFVDAGHLAENVRSDIERIKHMKPNHPVWIIFDDYGLIADVHEVVEEYHTNGDITIIEFIGHEPGYKFTENRILKDYEGVICVMP